MNYNRILNTLGYPHLDKTDFSDRHDFRLLISWLENRVIREWNIAERQVLHPSNDNWDHHFAGYLECLGCPFKWTASSADCIDWILSFSLDKHFEDSRKFLKICTQFDLISAPCRTDKRQSWAN